MPTFNYDRAVNQIATCQIEVKIHRLTQEEIDFHTRLRKRNSKKKYDCLSFDNDNFFEKACEDSYFSLTHGKRRRIRRTVKPIYYESSDNDEAETISYVPKVKIARSGFGGDEAIAVSVSTECVPKNEPRVCIVKPFVNATPTVKRKFTVLVPASKIRVKDAVQLGCKRIFIDEPETNTTKVFSSSSTLPSKLNSERASCGDKNKWNVQLLSRLFKRVYDEKNQSRIKKIADIVLQIIDDGERQQERIQEINNDSKTSYAEKLLSRTLSFKELNRKLTANQAAFTKQFDSISFLFDSEAENLPIVAQLFVLGVLKSILVTATDKKPNSVFKNVLRKISDALDCFRYKNDRLIRVLQMRNFREDCLELVNVIGDCLGTPFLNESFTSTTEETIHKKKYRKNSHFVSSWSVGSLKVVPWSEHLLLARKKVSTITATNLGTNFSSLQVPKLYGPRTPCPSATNTGPGMNHSSLQMSLPIPTHVQHSAATSTDLGTPINLQVPKPIATFAQDSPVIWRVDALKRIHVLTAQQINKIATAGNLHLRPSVNISPTNTLISQSSSNALPTNTFMGVSGTNISNSETPSHPIHSTISMAYDSNSVFLPPQPCSTAGPIVYSQPKIATVTSTFSSSFGEGNSRSNTENNVPMTLSNPVTNFVGSPVPLGESTNIAGSCGDRLIDLLSQSIDRMFQSSATSVNSVADKSQMSLRPPPPSYFSSVHNNAPGAYHFNNSTNREPIPMSSSGLNKDNTFSTSTTRNQCMYCMKEATEVCTGCQQAYYCGTECQKNDWRSSHRSICQKTNL